MKFILASNNQGKLREMQAILGAMGLEVVSLRDAGIQTDVEETGTTFRENAFLKAENACRLSGLPAIADDSGLEVEALGGQPGVYSARYGGEGLTDEDRYRLLLRNMEGVEQREARFVSHISCVFPNGDRLDSEGTCPGRIAHSPAGEGGFGYDPIFLMGNTDRTMAQITPEEKNRVSHRAAAIREFAQILKAYLEKE